jgi:protein-L-isoaspartate(D-aspartate) O-methyltransferase
MTDFSLQRHNMVESQVRPSDVTDRRIMRAMGTVPREAFVAPHVRALAYSEEPLPLEVPVAGTVARTVTPARTLAKLLALAEIEPGDRVLVVGAGRGYAAAVVVEMGVAAVVALEPSRPLADAARTALADRTEVTVVEGPLTLAPENGPFDVILVDGAVRGRPDGLLAGLADGGRCVAIVHGGGIGRAVQWRTVDGVVAERDGFDAAAPLLPGFEKPPAFVF